jgi:hypothetical protein
MVQETDGEENRWHNHAKPFRALSVFLEKGEEPRFSCPQDLLHLPAVQVFLQVSFE